VFTSSGFRIVNTPDPGSAANAYAERFVGTVRCECLGRLLIAGERHLRVVLAAFQTLHDEHCPHHGVGRRHPTINEYHRGGMPARPCCLISIGTGHGFLRSARLPALAGG